MRHKLINSKSVRIDGSQFMETTKRLAGVPIESGELFISSCGAKVRCPHIFFPEQVEKNRAEITRAVNAMYHANGHNVNITINFPSRFEEEEE